MKRGRLGDWIGGGTIGVLMVACVEGESEMSPTPEAIAPTFTDVQETVLSVSCAFSGCHAGPSSSADLNLSVEDVYGVLVNVPSSQIPTVLRVKPGDAANSYLVQKLMDVDGIVGDKMPPDGSIEEERLNTVVDWIDAGALLN